MQVVNGNGDRTEVENNGENQQTTQKMVESAEKVENTESTEEKRVESADVQKQEHEKNGYQKRIDSLVGQNYNLKRQLAEADKKFKEFEERFKSFEEKVAPKKFDDPRQEFEHHLENKIRGEFERREREFNESQTANERIAKVQTRIGESIQSTQEIFPDAQEVINSHNEPLPTEAIHFIMESDVSGPISYLIAKNPEIYQKIVSFEDPKSLERYLLRLEVKAESMMESARNSRNQERSVDRNQMVETGKVVTRTKDVPKPLQPMTPKTIVVNKGVPDPKTDLSAWIKMRNEQERRRNG